MKNICYNYNYNYNYNSIIELFEQNVVENQTDTALIYKDNYMSWNDLNTKANQLARKIKDKVQIKTNDVICICLSRSFEMIISIIAILKLQCCYCPINPLYPTKYKNYIIRTTDAKCIITFEKFDILNIEPNNFESYLKINFDNNYLTDIDYFACVVFTSGTTGKPKGVTIGHKSILNLMIFSKKINYNVVGLSTEYVFDAAICLIFYSLLNKKILVIQDKVTNKQNFTDEILKYNIDLILIPPSSFSIFHDFCLKTKFKKNINIILGGEKINLKKDDLFIFEQNNITLYNIYGPTECCVFVTVTKIYNNESVGKPIDNAIIYILDDNLNNLDTEQIGDIYIGGIPLSYGYIGDESRTNEVFINHKIYGKIYKTGDCGYYNKDGEIIFIGRKDNEIKYNGIRVNLDSIDNCIIELNNVVSSKTIVCDNILISFVLTNNNCQNMEYVNEYLLDRIPINIVPSHIINVPKFELTTNGKLNIDAMLEIYFKKYADIKINQHQQYLINLINDTVLQITNDHKLIYGNIICCDTPLLYYGLCSIKFTILISILNKKFGINFDTILKNDCSINDIIKIINDTPENKCGKLFVNKIFTNSKNLVIIFKDGCNCFPILLDRPIINEQFNNLDCDFYGITNHRYLNSSTYFNDVFKELSILTKMYKNIYILSDCDGYYGSIMFSFFAKKIILDSINFFDYQDNIELINIIRQKNNDIYFLYGDDYDYESVKKLNDIVKLNNIVTHADVCNECEYVKKHLMISNEILNKYIKFVSKIFLLDCLL